MLYVRWSYLRGSILMSAIQLEMHQIKGLIAY